jgi:hypothetical protein
MIINNATYWTFGKPCKLCNKRIEKALDIAKYSGILVILDVIKHFQTVFGK